MPEMDEATLRKATIGLICEIAHQADVPYIVAYDALGVVVDRLIEEGDYTTQGWKLIAFAIHHIQTQQLIAINN